MTCEESIKWLKSLYNELGQSQYQGLWHYEQALAETIELLQSDRLIELPFKIGDKVYYLSIKSAIPLTYKIVQAEVLNYNINRYGIFDAKVKLLNNSVFSATIDEIFLTKEEAEAKLKELNVDDKKENCQTCNNFKVNGGGCTGTWFNICSCYNSNEFKSIDD